MGKCVDVVYSSHIEMAKVHKPTIVSPNEDIYIEFKYKPSYHTFTIEQWTDDEMITSKDMTKETITITSPSKAGIYYYHLIAHWKEGTITYAFTILVVDK